MNYSIYNACIARRQWQNAANISGMSVHAIRMIHDKPYQDANRPTADAIDALPAHKPVTRRVMSANPRGGDVRDDQRAGFNPKNKPADPVWAAQVRARYKAIGWSLDQFSQQVGMHKSTVANALSPAGHLSMRMRSLILQALERGEKSGVS